MPDNSSPSTSVGTSTATVSSPAPLLSSIRPRDAFIAFSHGLCREILKILATGKSATPGELPRFNITADAQRKHLRAMCDVGIIASVPDKDGRKLSYFIPKQFLPEPGVVDYGFCRLRFS